jgi:2',3'-cyclic-nucleotide 2'-phosphodiesterase/3'-nucleotidase
MRVRAGLISVLATLLIAGCLGSSATPTRVPATPTPAPQATVQELPSLEPAATPAPTAAPTAASGGQVYVVKSGDTLYAISTHFKVTIKAILAANPEIKDPNMLKIGQKIVIPRK